jgi:hypothetical protein
MKNKERNELVMWDLADDGWKAVVLRRLPNISRLLHTPDAAKIDKFFLETVGMKNLSQCWFWPNVTADIAKATLQQYVHLRDGIAHRGQAERMVTKEDVAGYFHHVRHLVDETDHGVNDFLFTNTGKALPLPPELIAMIGECKCGENACVESNRRMPCFWPVGLPAWALKKHLYWRCYEQEITCDRCGQTHRRGDVGRTGICAKPFANQEQQAD